MNMNQITQSTFRFSLMSLIISDIKSPEDPTDKQINKQTDR